MSVGGFMAANGSLNYSPAFGNMNIHSTGFSQNMILAVSMIRDQTRTKLKSYEKICDQVPDNPGEYFVFLPSIRCRIETKRFRFEYQPGAYLL
jgi:hypothetical protein